jgi:glycosyltransferase involved in cell wall biosynthesis
MGTLLIVDNACPKPYCPEVLRTEGMGGTEATVVRVAEGLGSTHRVLIAQHNRRKEDTVRFKAVYSGMQVLDEVQAPDVVVVLRSFEWLADARRRYPGSRLLLWVTDWKRERGIFAPLMISRRTRFRRALTETNTTLLGVSSAHLEVLRSWARPGRLERLHRAVPDSTFVYNPVDDALTNESRDWDRNKLIYFSRPDGRLDQILRAFAYVRANISKDLRLLIGNPGYLIREIPRMPGVEQLGVLPHAEILGHVRTSLCAFYPNTRVPEAFGLVFAESNAVGTPVLTQRMGAAPEILSDEQFVDSANLEQVAQRIKAWWDGRRPVVMLNPRFRLSSVLKDWNRLLGWSSC